jgi:hypothetical protein
MAKNKPSTPPNHEKFLFHSRLQVQPLAETKRSYLGIACSAVEYEVAPHLLLDLHNLNYTIDIHNAIELDQIYSSFLVRANLSVPLLSLSALQENPTDSSWFFL